jgi:hypothetical protein
LACFNGNLCPCGGLSTPFLTLAPIDDDPVFLTAVIVENIPNDTYLRGVPGLDLGFIN